MNTTQLTTLERNVYGNNLINELSIQAIKKILPQLKGFLNKKISTVNGDKTKAFNIDLLEVPYIAESGQSYRSFLKFQHGTLILFNDVTVKVKEYEGGGHGVNYYKRNIDLGVVIDGILREIKDFDKICLYEGLTLKYDAKEQIKISQKIDQLETKIRLLKSKLVITL